MMDAAEGSDSEGDAQQRRGQQQLHRGQHQQEADDQVGRIIYEPVRLALAFLCPIRCTADAICSYLMSPSTSYLHRYATSREMTGDRNIEGG